MPRRKGIKAHPRLHLVPGGTWPDGPLEENAPLEALLAQDISKKFCEAVKARGWTRAEIARKTGISRKTIINIQNGDTWLDLPTIDRMERKLKLNFWNRAHHPPPEQRRST